MYSARRSDYDVTNTVRVSSAADVRDAVQELFESAWPGTPFAPVARAFHDFELAFTGRMPGYFGVDTVYHDQQHTLDVTLAMARLMVGYERTHAGTPQALGAERAAVGIFLALFHDIGYLRERSEAAQNGAEFTRNHVSRSARFMEFYLPTIGFAHWTRITSEIVHFTGYEKTFEQIGEKVHRSARHPARAPAGHRRHDRADGRPLLPREMPRPPVSGIRAGRRGAARWLPTAVAACATPRASTCCARRRSSWKTRAASGSMRPSTAPTAMSSRCSTARNPYIESIDRSLAFLRQVLRSESWRMLRRSPQVFAAEPDSLTSVRGLMASYFKRAWSRE